MFSIVREDFDFAGIWSKSPAGSCRALHLMLNGALPLTASAPNFYRATAAATSAPMRLIAQAFASQLAVERFDERIVCGLARAGEVEDHTALVNPQIHVPRDKFTTIVHPDRLRIADLPACPFQRRDHVFATIAEPGIDYRR